MWPLESICFVPMASLSGGLGRPWVAPLGKGLWELRVRTSRQLRILYFLHTGRTFVLLHAFVKKTREVPQSEIRIAARRMNEYLRRS